MKKITFIAIAMFSVSFLFAFEKKTENKILSASKEWAPAETNHFAFNTNNLLNPEFNLTAKRGEGESSNAFAQGKVVISAGYGWPNLGKTVVTALIADSITDTKATGMGPFHFRAEYGLSDKISFGVSVNYISFGAKYTDALYEYKISRSSLSILGRINFHFATTEQLDPYFGVGAGYKTAEWKFTSTDPLYKEESVPGFTPFGFEMTIGMRYYFVDGFGVYTELGIAKSIFQAGVVVAL